MSPLETRKRLLLVESELNRLQMTNDLAALQPGLADISRRLRSLTRITSATAILVTGLAVFTRTKTAPAQAKPSWLKRLIRGAGLLSTLWVAFQPDASRSKNS